MPELPEVEVLRLSLEPHLVGDTIERVEVSNPALREPVDVAKLRKAARGRQILALCRRSKYLLIDLAGGWTLVVHLGMSGRLTLAPAGTTSIFNSAPMRAKCRIKKSKSMNQNFQTATALRPCCNACGISRCWSIRPTGYASDSRIVSAWHTSDAGRRS